MARVVNSATVSRRVGVGASLHRQRRWFVIGLVAPAGLVLLVFQVLPILMGVDASLRNYSLTDAEHPFVGFKNSAAS